MALNLIKMRNIFLIKMSLQLQYFLAAGFGFVLLSSTVALVLVLNNTENSERKNTYHSQAEDAITFEEFINREFSAKTFNGSWWSETELQWKDTVKNGTLKLLASRGKQIRILVNR